jgi:hypothetical protein
MCRSSSLRRSAPHITGHERECLRGHFRWNRRLEPAILNDELSGPEPFRPVIPFDDPGHFNPPLALPGNRKAMRISLALRQMGALISGVTVVAELELIRYLDQFAASAAATIGLAQRNAPPVRPGLADALRFKIWTRHLPAMLA